MDAPVQWGHSEWLLARIAYATEVACWQRGGGKGRRPKPPRPPGSKDPHRQRRRVGAARPMTDVRNLLDRWKAGEVTAREVSDG